MGRFQRSLELAKASWRTLRADRELLALPMFSFIGSLIVAGAALGLVFLIDYDPALGIEEFQLSTSGGIVLVLAGILLAVVATFFQAAMVGGANERLTGGDPTVASALAVAKSRVGVIVAWAIFSWTIGAILRAIEERAGAIGRIVVGFIGMAFRVVTFLAVPVLVFENIGPVSTLKRSADLFRQKWGENLIAQAGLGIVAFLAIIPIALVAAVLGAVIHPIVAVIVALPLIAVLMVVMTSLTAIYQTALYHYVTTNEIPGGFESAGLEASFRTR